MTIGDVFAKAWELWRRDVGWLILAGLVVGVIVFVVVAVLVVVVGGMMAVSIGGIAVGQSNSSAGLTGVGVGTLIGALLVALIGGAIVSVISVVFYGGMFQMVIGAARERRGVEFGELFSGFRKFGSFVVLWLVVFGIGIVCGLVFLIPILGWIAVPLFLAWLGTTWLYVLPLIADRGMTFGEAASTSRQMVRNAGWWKTFGVVIVLGVAFAVIMLVISLIQRESSTVGGLLTFVFEILAFPFAICYVTTMYLQAGGETAGQPALAYGAPGGGPFAPAPAGLGQPAPPPPLVAPLVAPLVPPPAPPAIAGGAPPPAAPPPSGFAPAPPPAGPAVLPPPPAPPVLPVAAPPAPPPADPEVTGVTQAAEPEAVTEVAGGGAEATAPEGAPPSAEAPPEAPASASDAAPDGEPADQPPAPPAPPAGPES